MKKMKETFLNVELRVNFIFSPKFLSQQSSSLIAFIPLTEQLWPKTDLDRSDNTGLFKDDIIDKGGRDVCPYTNFGEQEWLGSEDDRPKRRDF